MHRHNTFCIVKLKAFFVASIFRHHSQFVSCFFCVASTVLSVTQPAMTDNLIYKNLSIRHTECSRMESILKIYLQYITAVKSESYRFSVFSSLASAERRVQVFEHLLCIMLIEVSLGKSFKKVNASEIITLIIIHFLFFISKVVANSKTQSETEMSMKNVSLISSGIICTVAQSPN